MNSLTAQILTFSKTSLLHLERDQEDGKIGETMNKVKAKNEMKMKIDRTESIFRSRTVHVNGRQSSIKTADQNVAANWHKANNANKICHKPSITKGFCNFFVAFQN